MTNSKKPFKGNCTKCGAPATHHICEHNDGEKTIYDLCEACALTMQVMPKFPKLEGEVCYYCNGKAEGATPNQLYEEQIRGQKFHIYCVKCLEIYSELLLQRLKDVPSNLTQAEQMNTLSKLIKEVDEEVINLNQK